MKALNEIDFLALAKKEKRWAQNPVTTLRILIKDRSKAERAWYNTNYINSLSYFSC
ncbi:MAG: hypothetical protein ACI9FJ_002332 [Alteromonadaceae bacterium]|jgi:hypothetical protein